MATPAGRLSERLTFQARVIESDGYGNTRGDFADEFTVSASVTPRLGGESVLAGRLTGRHLVNIVVRYSPETVMIGTDWRAVDARDTSKIYNIRDVIDPDPDRPRRFIELLAERGVAA